jgi:glycosyltransferase involved in cell wall biosynthesis
VDVKAWIADTLSRNNPMNILSFNWHTPYLSLLVQLDHTFDVAPANRETLIHPEPWHETMRPLMPNVTPITKEEALNRLKRNDYDLVLGHNVGDLVLTEHFSLPKILVFHTRLTTEAQASGKLDIIPSYRKSVRELISGVYCVFIAQTKRYDWSLPGEVILPGIDVSLYGGYTGEVPRALRVGNMIKLRDLTSGYSIQEAVLRDLPSIAIGDNPDIPSARPSKNWDDLKQAYRENRLFLITNIPKWEDGYNLAMLEAMATGMPVVSLANPVSPLTDGHDGFVSGDVPILRQRVKQLLADTNLAKTIGAEGKRTVGRHFPIGPFLEKWERAIQRAYAWYPHEPKHIFVKDQSVKGRMSSRAPSRQRFKKMILSYTSHPATAAAYLERALKRKLDVLTVGAKLPPFVIEAWKLQALKEEAKPHDISTPDFTVDIEYMLERLPGAMDHDFFLWIETGLGLAPENLDRLSIPKAVYLIDTRLNLPLHIEMAKSFDVAFLAQRAYISDFNKCGIKNVYWLPLACDPEIHGRLPVQKEYDVGFVGSVTDERRIELLRSLSKTISVRYKRAFLQEMTEHFCRSRIVFNSAIRKDLNMRVFEAMCSGSMLLTDHADGLDDFFQDRKHLVVYNDDNLADVAEHYLRRDAEREQVARAGRLEVLAKHTYDHRAEEIIRVMEGVLA